MVSVRRSFKHSYREQETHNADPERKDQNLLFDAKTTPEAMKLFRDRLPEKLRKNGVLCVEHLVTASPEWFEGKTLEEENKYFQDSLKFINEKWGEDNVICGGVHRDEKTPHMFVYVVPKDRDTGKLNCRKWLGEQGALSQMQDDFYESAGKSNGLERGVKGSKAKHQTLKKYYTGLKDLERLENYREPSKKDFLQASMGIKSEKVEKIKKAGELVAVCVTRMNELKRDKDKMAKSHNQLSSLVEPLKESLRGLEGVELERDNLVIKSKIDDEKVQFLMQQDEENKRKLSTYRQILNKDKESKVDTNARNNNQELSR